jgi:tetratricopeptide (TPR) repeat protein
MQEYRRLEMDSQAGINRTREILVTSRGAAALFLEGKSEEAFAMFRKGIASYPEAAGIYLNLAIAQSKAGRHGEALRTFQTMIDRGFGDHFLVHRYLAQQYQALADSKASQRHSVTYLQKIDAAIEAALN